MKAAKAWCVAGLCVMAGFSSASCGKDEASGGDGTGGGLVGGSGGSSAGTRTGGTGGSGGSAVVSATKLGRGCIDDADCDDTTAPGLTCVTSTDTVLANGAPPKGLCTYECTSDDDCTPYGAGALCYPFTTDADTGYCVEGCAFGEPGIGEVKCHNRQEFACNPALLGDTGQPCTTTAADCQSGELCIEGTCAVVFPACLPSCRGDIDCEDGMYCDQSFLSGVCVTEKPTGKGLGEPCTVPADDEPSEPDECIGFCQADATGSSAGHCAATCGLISSCAYNAGTGLFDGICFYASILTSETGDVGDFGFCTPTCNCTSECNDDALSCSLLTQGALNDTFRGPGLCFTPDADTIEYNQCEGMGGAGSGAGAGGAGTSDGGEPAAMGGGGAGG